MRARSLALTLALASLCRSAAAAPKRPAKIPGIVDVVVIEVAGTHVYIKPGTAAGVRRGSRVLIGQHETLLTVTNATTSFAIVDLGDDPPKEGEKGKATIVEETEVEATKLKKPRPESAFEDVWSKPEPPAAGKAVRFVPLGDGDANRKNDVRLTLLTGGSFPLGDRGSAFAHAELNARVRAEPFSMPLAFLLDASIQSWAGPGVDTREGSSARPVIRAREILLAYGTQEGFSANFGRMRYAAATLDTLDGLRLRTTISDTGIFVAAFGGLLPNPNNGTPTVDAQRFGAEVGYSDPKSTLRPEGAIVINGSTFNGNLDERRIGGVLGLFPGNARLGAHFEVGGYPDGNPFKASAFELNNGGVDGSVLFGPVQVGARIDMRKPDRSLWLANYLPLDFFCLVAPPVASKAGASVGAPVCDGRSETRVEGSLDATLAVNDMVVAAGATTARDVVIGGLPSMFGGYANGRLLHIAQMFRADAGLAYNAGSYLNMVSFNAGPGVSLLDEALDLGAYYRFASVQYLAGGDPRLENGIGLTGTYIPSRTFALSLQAEAIRGSDIDALIGMLTAMYRPQL